MVENSPVGFSVCVAFWDFEFSRSRCRVHSWILPIPMENGLLRIFRVYLNTGVPKDSRYAWGSEGEGGGPCEVFYRFCLGSPTACVHYTDSFFGSSHLECGFSCATNSPTPDTVGAYTLFEVPYV